MRETVIWLLACLALPAAVWAEEPAPAASRQIAVLTARQPERLLVTCLDAKSGQPVEAARVKASCCNAAGFAETVEGLTDGDGCARLAARIPETTTVLVHVVKDSAQVRAESAPEPPAPAPALPRLFLSTETCLPGEAIGFVAQIRPGPRGLQARLVGPSGKAVEQKLAVSPTGWLGGKLELSATAEPGRYVLFVGGVKLAEVSVPELTSGVRQRMWAEKRVFRPGEPVRCVASAVDEAGKRFALSGGFLFRRWPDGREWPVGPVSAPPDAPLTLAFMTNTPGRCELALAQAERSRMQANVLIAADGAGMSGGLEAGILTDRDIYSPGQTAVALFTAPPSCKLALASISAHDALAWRLLRFDQPTQCAEVAIPATFQGDLTLRLTWCFSGAVNRFEKRVPVVPPAGLPPDAQALAGVACNAVPPAQTTLSQPSLEQIHFPAKPR